MTEEQLKTLRAECRALAAESAVAVLYRALEQYQPDVLPLLREKAIQALEEYQALVLPDRSAEYSDLISAEFRDAFYSMVEKFFGARP